MFKKILLWAALPLSASAILFFYYLHFRYSVNIPIMDDYDAVIYFLSSFIDTGTVSEKLLWLITQHREHRYLFPRIFILIYFYIFGQINFKIILFFGLAALFGVYALLLKTISFSNIISSVQNKILIACSVTFIFFNLQYWEGSTWAIAAFFFYFGLLFSFISIYLLAKDAKHSFLAALSFAMLAVATSGNGLLVFIIGAVILYIKNKVTKQLIIWLVSSSVVYFFYFYKYVSPSDQTPVTEIILHKQYKLLIFYLSYLGSVFRQIPAYGYEISVIAGAVFILMLFFLIIKKYYRVNPVNFGFILFLFLTMLASSLGRVDVGFISRYTVFAALLLICLSVSFFEICSVRIRTVHLLIFFLVSIGFNIYSYAYNIGDMKKMKDILVNGAILAKAGDYSLLVYPDSSSVKNLVQMGYSKRIYYFPDYEYKDFICNEIDVSKSVSLKNMAPEINRIQNNENYFYITGWINSTSGMNNDNSPIYIVLRSEKNTFVFKTISMRRKELSDVNKKKEVIVSSFSFAILKETMSMPEGIYDLGFLVKDSNTNELIWTENKILF